MRVRLLIPAMILCMMQGYAQSAFLHRHDESFHIVERYSLLAGRNANELHTAVNPISQKDAVSFLEKYLAQHSAELSAKEQQEIQDFLAMNSEWTEHGHVTLPSKHPFLKTLYATRNDLLHIEEKDYDLIVNPIIAYQQTVESGTQTQNEFLNTKGIEVRGNIGKRLGFYTRFTDNQERGPLHHQQYVLQRQAVPGVTYFKDINNDKTVQDYILATGYIDADIIRQKVNLSFGNDRFQLGDGYRSLFLDDVGSNYLFLRLNTRLGKFNYQNLFMELVPQYTRGADQLLPRKYAAIHHLSMHVTPRLNIGLFESIVFARKDHFDFSYLNPIILYRSVEQTNGSPDNAMMGMNVKISTPWKMMIYGQVLLDEFSYNQMKKKTGWWANKYGLQLGLKRTDLFGIKHLLIQPEFNLIRPFTYSYQDSVSEYSHYNQSLAHPYGANLIEMSLLLQYRMGKKWHISWKSFYNKQGRDTASTVSFGGNLFNTYTNRSNEYGIRLFNGYASTVTYSNLNIAFEYRPSLFVDFGLRYRKESSVHPANPSFSSRMVYLGFRLHMSRREYDY